jgi:hypothetical protein
MNYKEIRTKILQLEEEGEERKNRLEGTQRRLQEDREYLDTLSERFKKAVLGEDEKFTKSVEAEAAKIQVSVKGDGALIEGLNEEIPRLQRELEKLKTERGTIIAGLAKKWLENEKPAYDMAAREVLHRGRRLILLYGLLREIDRGDTYTQEIPCYEFIPGMRVPIIENFDQGQFLYKSPFHETPGTQAEILEEVTKEM